MRTKGLTLVELMLVVAILGILGALVLPVYQGHAAEAKNSSAKANLHALRTQIELYKMQHEGALPGYMSGTPVSGPVAKVQLEQTTSLNGIPSGSKTTSGSYIYGPYLLTVPENPLNGESAIAFSTDFGTDLGTAGVGWLYNYVTGQIVLNSDGTDEDGIAYVDY